MTIKEANNAIQEILKKHQGIRRLEIYDFFVREYNGCLNVENKSFEQILEKMVSDGILAKSFCERKEEYLYYFKEKVNADITFFGVPTSCWKCRFGITDLSLVKENLKTDTRESDTLIKNLREHKYACLLDPELVISGSDEFSWRYGRKPNCPRER